MANEANIHRESRLVKLKTLQEKGYNPLNQLCGYLVSADPTYITNHNNARALITQVEREDILEAITEDYIERI